jgi:hypothetical protein
MIVRSVGVGKVWDCILCTSVSEEGGDGEGTDSEEPSPVSYHLDTSVSWSGVVVYYESINREFCCLL